MVSKCNQWHVYNVRRKDSKRKECKVSRKRRERKGERERKRETERETKGRNSSSKERGANSSSCTIGFLSVTFPTSSKKTLHVSRLQKNSGFIPIICPNSLHYSLFYILPRSFRESRKPRISLGGSSEGSLFICLSVTAVDDNIWKLDV